MMNKRTTAQGWDIYVDTHKDIVLVSLNMEMVTKKAKDELSNSFKKLSGYKVVVIDNINNIEYADVEKLLEEIKKEKDDENE